MTTVPRILRRWSVGCALDKGERFKNVAARAVTRLDSALLARAFEKFEMTFVFRGLRDDVVSDKSKGFEIGQLAFAKFKTRSRGIDILDAKDPRFIHRSRNSVRDPSRAQIPNVKAACW